MEAANGMFFAKLLELDEFYRSFRQRIQLCQNVSSEQFGQEKQRMEQEIEAAGNCLKEYLRVSPSPTATQFAKALDSFCQRTDEILHQLPDGTNEQAEAATLCAEYFIDLTEQAMQYTLLAVYYAVAAQNEETL